MNPARVVHHQAVDDSPAVQVGSLAVNAAARVEADPVACPACGAPSDGRGSTSVEQVEPLCESPWRASCSRCGWYQDEHYIEDAEGEADEHQCPMCAARGHREPNWAPGEHTAP